MDTTAKAIKKLTGAQTRIVWAQPQTDMKDFVGIKPDYKLLAMETDEEHAGERIVLGKVGSYCTPMIAPKGDRIIYSDLTDFNVKIVNWDGTNNRTLHPGFAVGVWEDPRSGVEHVLIRPEKFISWNSKSRPVTLHPIDDISTHTVLWDKTNITKSWFQLSRDGTRAAAVAPWPQCGSITIPNGEFNQLAKGCWTGMAPDNSYRMWIFRYDHRQLDLYNAEGRRLHSLFVNGADAMKGWEVYYPRWTNNIRFLTVSGPFSGGRTDWCPEGNNENLINRGGTNIELFLGRLNEDLTEVEKWVQITNNDKADFFGHAWIADSEIPQ